MSLYTYMITVADPVFIILLNQALSSVHECFSGFLSPPIHHIANFVEMST